MKLKVEIPPETRKTFLALRELGEDIKLGLRDALEESLGEIHSAALASLQRAKHGRVYRTRGRRHQASAPGEPPASLSGELARSIKIKVFSDGVSGAVYSRLDKAWWLESGAMNRLVGGTFATARVGVRFRGDGTAFQFATRRVGGKSNRLDPRPFLVPARDANFERFVQRIVAKIDGAAGRFNSGG